MSDDAGDPVEVGAEAALVRAGQGAVGLETPDEDLLDRVLDPVPPAEFLSYLEP